MASGLADYFGTDPAWIRIAFVAATFLGPGLIAYIVLWVVTPEWSPGFPPGAPAPRHPGGAPDARLVAGVILLVIAALVLAGTLGSGYWGLVWGAVLVVAGVLLLTEGRWTSGVPDHPVTASSPSWQPPVASSFPDAPYASAAATAQSFTPPMGGAWGQPAGAYAAPPAGSPWAAPVSRSRAFPVGLATTAALLLALGAWALLGSLGVFTLSVGAGFGLALLVIGAGLIAGAWFGRSWWLIACGLVLLPFAAAASLIHEPVSGGAGQFTFTPTSVSAIQPSYRLGAGQLTVDLSQVDIGAATVHVTVSDAVGQVVVVVPDGIPIDVTASAGAGETDVLGHVSSGLQVDDRVDRPGSGVETGSLNLDVSVGLGQVTVRQAAAGVTGS